MILVTKNGFSDVQGISDRLLGYVFDLTRDDTIHSYVICFGTMHIFQAFYTGYINDRSRFCHISEQRNSINFYLPV